MFGFLRKLKTRNFGILEVGKPEACVWSDIKGILSAYDKKLGPGWRIPTSEELLFIYDIHELGIGGFEKSNYWSSEEANISGSKTAMSFITKDFFYHSSKENFLLVPVRTIN